jgi:predicted membrane protein
MVDHAGQPTTSFNPSIIGIGKNAGTGGMSRGAYRAFIRDMRRRHAQPIATRCLGALFLLGAFLMAPLTIWDIVDYGLTLDTLRQSVWMLVIAGLATCALTSHGLPHEVMVKELLARSNCASCGFDLAGVRVDGEGLSLCPECGCRWRIASSEPAA